MPEMRGGVLRLPSAVADGARTLAEVEGGLC